MLATNAAFCVGGITSTGTLMWLVLVFLRARMTVGAEMDSTTFRVTNPAASRRNVHRACPGGGSLLSELDQAGFLLASQNQFL